MTAPTTTFSAADEMAHTPGPEPGWQESLFLAWHDPATRLGGVHRIGHEPGAGTANLWWGVVTGDGTGFRLDLDGFPLDGDDRGPERFGAGPCAFTFDGALHLGAEHGDCALALDVEDFYAPTHVWDRALPMVGRATVSNHYEASGRVRGRVRLGDREVTVDGLCHRDHSWGPRDWSRILSHRWLAGSCGTELSFSATLMQGTDGRFLSGGAVVRAGVVTPATGVDIAVIMEADGVSHRGGWAELTLEGGEVVRLDAGPVGGVVFDQSVHVEVDTICTVRTPDGHEGFCDLEVSNGLRRNVPFARRALLGSGLVREGGPV